MKFPEGIEVVGDRSFRGDCPSERAEQVTLVAAVREMWPDTLGRLIVHNRNEGKRDYRQTAIHKAEGMTPGASDILIPGSPAIVIELKRRDHTQSRLPKPELTYLLAAQAAGCRVCVALGWEAAFGFIAGGVHCKKP